MKEDKSEKKRRTTKKLAAIFTAALIGCSAPTDTMAIHAYCVNSLQSRNPAIRGYGNKSLNGAEDSNLECGHRDSVPEGYTPIYTDKSKFIICDKQERENK